MIVTALWSDVQKKAYRLLTENRVQIDAISTYSILCSVDGDHDSYQTYVNNDARVQKDNSVSKANWYCTCPWGNWSNTGRRPHDGEDSYGTVKSFNRFCSHAYAAYLMLQQYRKLSKERNKLKDQQFEEQVNDQDVDEQTVDYDSQDMTDQQDIDMQDYEDEDSYEDDYDSMNDSEDDDEDEDDRLSLI